MFRKMITAAVAVAALLLSTLALNASAQDGCSYYNATATSACAEALPLPDFGPQSFAALAPAGVVFPAGTDVTATAAVAAPAGGGAGLAVTGSESTVLGYVGTGLIAFGAVAMGSRRKFLQGALD